MKVENKSKEQKSELTELDKLWIYIGEVEMPDEDHSTPLPNGATYALDENFGCGSSKKHFLYKRQVGEGFMYSIVANRRKAGAEGYNPVYIEKDYSIFTILTIAISHELANFRGDSIRKFKKKRIRLVGMTNWIKSNEDYLHYKINEDDLEKLFESNRIG